jgi:CBS domain-containing protein
MSPRTVSQAIVREVPCVPEAASVEQAVAAVRRSGLPGLPVVDEEGRLVGVFGEREFMEALFPGWVKELRYAAFVPKSLDDAIEERSACRTEPVARYMNTEHIDVATDASDVQVAEVFLHHRVLLAPVTDRGRVVGAIMRSEFFAALADRFLGEPQP